MKRYIKPSTDITSVELQQMIAASPDLSGGEATQGAEHEYDDAKGFDFIDDGSTPPTVNVWED